MSIHIRTFCFIYCAWISRWLCSSK